MYGSQDEEAKTLIENKKNRSKIRVHSTQGQREMAIKNVDTKFTTGNNFYSNAKRTNFLDGTNTMSMMSSIIPNKSPKN